MQKYAVFAPTCFDPKGLNLPDQQEWLVCPVSRTRDSGPFSESNFATMEKMLEGIDPDGNDHENHRFNHWGPGWFEILIVRPHSTCLSLAEEAELCLEDYPLLDEEDHSRREYEEACESWEWIDRRDRIEICAKHNVSIFAARRNEIPQGLPYFDDFYSPVD